MPRGSHKLTQEQRERLAEATAEAVAKRAADRQNALVIGAFRIYRFDAENVVLQKGDEDPKYYPDVAWALKALLREEISQKVRPTLAQVQADIANAEKRILSALRQRATTLF